MNSVSNASSPAPLPARRPLRVGLTGGIASGKSLIEAELKRQGIPSIDADVIVHNLLKRDEELKTQIRQEFGDAVLTPEGGIDRKRLAAVVFDNPQQRRRLEGMIHPKVRQRITLFFEQCEAEQKKLGVAVIPLIFESNLQDNYDVVWLVKATEDQQIDRLTANRGMTREEALARIRSQMPWAEKLNRLQSLAHYRVIDNTGAPEQTRTQVERLLNEIA